MLPESDPRIEAFRQEVKRLSAIPGILDTLGITIARADELPGLIAKESYPLNRQWLQEEQGAIGPPIALRLRQVQLENELRQGLASIGDSLRAAIDAAKAHVIMAAGGESVARSLPLTRRHLELLTRYSNPLPSTETIRLRLALLSSAWWLIDAAIGSLDEIQYAAQAEWGGLLNQ